MAMRLCYAKLGRGRRARTTSSFASRGTWLHTLLGINPSAPPPVPLPSRVPPPPPPHCAACCLAGWPEGVNGAGEIPRPASLLLLPPPSSSSRRRRDAPDTNAGPPPSSSPALRRRCRRLAAHRWAAASPSQPSRAEELLPFPLPLPPQPHLETLTRRVLCRSLGVVGAGKEEEVTGVGVEGLEHESRSSSSGSKSARFRGAIYVGSRLAILIFFFSLN
uniref:Uncharacterized protein n=1 Tax=Oryza sativa subsp. japonica TaxID=39947 RepID=Q69U59_ORYSJ|nr:hypothetical protein [Oryza sativa Japonica Group]